LSWCARNRHPAVRNGVIGRGGTARDVQISSVNQSQHISCVVAIAAEGGGVNERRAGRIDLEKECVRRVSITTSNPTVGRRTAGLLLDCIDDREIFAAG